MKQEITKNQITVLKLLYRFRFLTRVHIQSMMGHSTFNRIIVWLNDLVNKGYVSKEFTRQFGAKPTVYWLATKSRNVLLNHGDLTSEDLKIIYKEKTRSRNFKETCLIIADISISLVKLTKSAGSKLHFYTRTDLWGMKGMILPIPDAYFAIEEPNGLTKRYFLDIFSAHDPRMWYRKRITQYQEYYDDGYWQKSTDKTFPEIILVCGDEVMKRYISKQIVKLLEDEGSDLLFYVTTIKIIKTKGLNQSSIELVVSN